MPSLITIFAVLFGIPWLVWEWMKSDADKNAKAKEHDEFMKKIEAENEARKREEDAIISEAKSILHTFRMGESIYTECDRVKTLIKNGDQDTLDEFKICFGEDIDVPVFYKMPTCETLSLYNNHPRSEFIYHMASIIVHSRRYVNWLQLDSKVEDRVIDAINSGDVEKVDLDVAKTLLRIRDKYEWEIGECKKKIKEGVHQYSVFTMKNKDFEEFVGKKLTPAECVYRIDVLDYYCAKNNLPKFDIRDWCPYYYDYTIGRGKNKQYVGLYNARDKYYDFFDGIALEDRLLCRIYRFLGGEDRKRKTDLRKYNREHKKDEDDTFDSGDC